MQLALAILLNATVLNTIVLNNIRKRRLQTVSLKGLAVTFRV